MKQFILACGLLCYALGLQAQVVTLELWHGMAGGIGEEVRRLVDGFNASQSEYRIRPVYKGGYIETLTSFAASFRAQKPPALVQVFEVGSAMMLIPEGVIKPVDDLMQEQGLSLPKDDFIPAVRDYYSKQGKLMAMPFNLSVPVLFYNRDKLAKLGYSKDNFPTTWAGMEILVKKMKKAGFSCGYTSGYPGWILVESYVALHGLPLMRGDPPQIALDKAALIKHFKRLKRWQQAHYFQYGGRVDDAMTLFTSGLCPMMSQSSGTFASLTATVSFPVGVALMPLDEEVSKRRHANVLGGAALWAVAGQSPSNYRGIAQFFAFLAQAKTQQQWHKGTGYLPLGLKGIYASLLNQDSQPTLRLAQIDLGEDRARENSLGPKNQMRAVYDESLEAMFADLLSPTEAVLDIIVRCNRLLQRFAKNQPARSQGPQEGFKIRHLI